MNHFLRRRRKPGTPSDTAIAARTVAEDTANEITMKRILAWHGACVCKLVEQHTMGQIEADATAMMLFDEKCRREAYLAWPSPEEVARDYKAEPDA